MYKSKDIKVSIDSRTINKGEYFVPVKGENFDGHDYIKDAYKKGATGILEEDELYKIASEKLHRINPCVIAITGSVGKSTMRDFLYDIFSAQFKVCKGYLNTKLGLAVNIINDLKSDDEFFIAETGMDFAGELTITGNFLKPHIGVITNISESHMEKLGTLENIIKAKADLVHTIRKEGKVYINWDNGNIRTITKMIPGYLNVIKYGVDEVPGYSAESINELIEERSSKYRNLKFDYIPFKFTGKHNILNAVGAFAIAYENGVDIDRIINKMHNIVPPKGRMNLRQTDNGYVIIDDTYNSSPVSAVKAIEETSKYHLDNNLGGRKIAVLGGMRELGSYENEGHSIVGDMIAEEKFDVLVLVGSLSKKYQLSKKLKKSNTQTLYFNDNQEASNYIADTIKPQKGDIILFKASRAFKLEEIIEKVNN